MVTFEVPSPGSSVDSVIDDCQLGNNESRSNGSSLTLNGPSSTSHSDIDNAFLAYIWQFPDEPTNKPWQLKLPISGAIAQRRALSRGERPADIAREQNSLSQHQHAVKFGPLANVDTNFRQIEWGAPSKHQSMMGRINGGEPVSPKTMPRPEQMNVEEYADAFGGCEGDGA